jgi:glycosyltransferase involved in cell wall biosynthesis
MTVYNGMAYLKEAIDSVLNQSYKDFEFLIIDDASTDDSVSFIKSYNDSRIKLIENSNNLGQTNSLNLGLTIAKGEFIARLDQDDVNLWNRLEDQVKYLEDNKDITIVCSWEHTINQDAIIVRNWKRTIPNFGYFIGKITLGLCPVWHPSVMFRKKDIENLGNFDIYYGPAEDYELWSRLAMNRLNGAILKKFHLFQRLHDKRQSILQNDKQIESTKLAHIKFLKYFLPFENDIDILLLSNFLRLNISQTDIFLIHERRLIFYKLLYNIKNKCQLNIFELFALKYLVYSRIGITIILDKFFYKLPARIYKIYFYTFSPLFNESLRIYLSTLVFSLHRIINRFKNVFFSK